MSSTGLASDAGATPIERIARPFQIFARFKASGAVVLLAASVAALLWANSEHAGLYESLRAIPVGVGVGTFGLSKPLLLWINDALMGIFFFVVGLEIKREMLAGDLSSPRKAALPIFAAIGGMIVPAALFALLNSEGIGAHGWGIPMATDIAFALGVLALLGERVPLGLKVFLTALAIVDDIGAIVVIAVFYTEDVSILSLILGGLLVGVSALFNVLGVRSAVVYFGIGTLVWLAFLKSGVHATLASVLMAMTIPARTRIDGRGFLERMEALLERLRSTGVPEGGRLLDANQQSILQHIEHSIDAATAPLQQLEHALVPIVTFLVLPVFALANAGVSASAGLVESLRNPVCLGIVLGLFVGKPVGVLGFAWLATRTGLAALPKGVTWRQIHAVGVLAGIGFTMALFIGGLAYEDPELQSVSKVGILSASALSSVVGSILLWLAIGRETPVVSGH
jgi:NhaA family Na+:H+ antiporter